MRFSVIIPTRKRTRGLSAVLTSLDMLSSGKHEITYGIAIDDDDPASRLFAFGLQEKLPLAIRSGPRPESLGGLVNDMAARMPADVYLSLCDDVLILQPDWDQHIAEAVEKKPYGVFWWKNVVPKTEAMYAIVTEKWRFAAGGIFTNYYPFWFDDWVLLELWMMATGQDVQQLPLAICDKPKHTHRLRDLSFWQRFYTATRPMRARWAIDIAESLGLEPQNAHAIADRLSATLHPMPEDMAAPIEAQGDQEAPDDSYLRAKARAEALLKTLNEERLAA